MAAVGSVFTRRQWIRPLMIHRIVVLAAVVALDQAQMAAQIQGKSAMADASAAALILDSHLNKNK